MARWGEEQSRLLWSRWGPTRPKSRCTERGGTLVVQVLQHVGSEIGKRLLSAREDARVGRAILFAIEKNVEKRRNGLELRDDGFFDERSDGRTTAEEIVEGVLLVAQREYEEKKVRFQSYLLVNLAYRPDVSRSQAHALIRLASELTYQQYCILSVLCEHVAWDFGDATPPSADLAVVRHDIVSIGFRGILSLSGLSGRATIGGTFPGSVGVQPIGSHLCDLMELSLIDEQDRRETEQAIHALLRYPPVPRGPS